MMFLCVLFLLHYSKQLFDLITDVISDINICPERFCMKTATKSRKLETRSENVTKLKKTRNKIVSIQQILLLVSSHVSYYSNQDALA